MKRLIVIVLLLSGCSAAIQIGPNPKPDITKQEVLSYFQQMDQRVQSMIGQAMQPATGKASKASPKK